MMAWCMSDRHYDLSPYSFMYLYDYFTGYTVCVYSNTYEFRPYSSFLYGAASKLNAFKEVA